MINFVRSVSSSILRECGNRLIPVGGTMHSKHRRVKRWVHEAVLDAMQERLDNAPEAMPVRKQTVEHPFHPFGTLKAWMGATHILTKTLEQLSTEMSLHVLAYNMKHMMKIVGIGLLMQAMEA